MKTTVGYLLVICLIKVKEMVDYIFAQPSASMQPTYNLFPLLYLDLDLFCFLITVMIDLTKLESKCTFSIFMFDLQIVKTFPRSRRLNSGFGMSIYQKLSICPWDKKLKSCQIYVLE